MPRIIWKGAISFGLVHIPVVLHPGSKHVGVSFDLLDRRTADPVGYRRVNKSTGEELRKEDIVRGFEYEDGRYVMLSDEEIRSANVESTQTVDILSFVDEGSIPVAYYETPYYLAPDRRGEKVYALLREAMKRTRKIGVASVVLHTRQHLAMLSAQGPALMLETLRWADEVLDILKEMHLPPEGTKRAQLHERELAMAVRLIEEMTGPWDPKQYHDTFHDDIVKLVERKVKAGKTHVVEAVEPTAQARRGADVVDLTDLLKRSLRHHTDVPAHNARTKTRKAPASTRPKERRSPRGSRRAQG